MAIDLNNIMLIDLLKTHQIKIEDLRKANFPADILAGIERFFDEQRYWESIKDSNAGIQEYLKKYPNGFFCDEANEALKSSKGDEVLSIAHQENTILTYEAILNKCLSGKFRMDTDIKVGSNGNDAVCLKKELFDDMRANPSKYNYPMMRWLYDPIPLTHEQREFLKSRDDVCSRFLSKGFNITHQELIDNNVLPETVSKEEVCANEYCNNGLRPVKDLGKFPKDRTEVYFLGLPGTGRTTILSGLIYEFIRQGIGVYCPQCVGEEDVTYRMYKSLLSSIRLHKPLVGNGTDLGTCIKIDVKKNSRITKLNFIDCGGESVRDSAFNQIKPERERVRSGGFIEEFWKNKNKKILFFVIDYSRYEDCYGIDQNEFLRCLLQRLSSDGPDPENPQKECTMSRVETVAILVTKSDLMQSETLVDKLHEAMERIQERSSCFMNELKDFSKQFGINKANNYKPYVMLYSIGKFYVGNTYVYNPCYSKNLLDFIIQISPGTRKFKLPFFN